MLFDSQGQYFLKNIILHSKHRRKTLECIIYYNNDKCFLVLVIYMFVMFYFFFLQKAENNRLKKASWPTFCNIILLFLLKLGTVGPVDQQINYVLPQVFPLKFDRDTFYISIIKKSIIFNWNITSSPYLEMVLINMIKLLSLCFLSCRNVRFYFMQFAEALTAGNFHIQIF